MFMTPFFFTASWSRILSILTVVASVAILGGAAVSAEEGQVWLSVLLVAIWLVCLTGHVRGYFITGETLRIQRLFHGHDVDLSTVTKAELCPGLLRRSVRVGNGGVFSFSGWFWNRTHGWVRAVATDAGERCVLLTAPDRKWVVSPDDPPRFVETVREAAGLA